MSIDDLARQHIEQQWENLPATLEVIDAEVATDRLADVLYETLSDDAVLELVERLQVLLATKRTT